MRHDHEPKEVLGIFSTPSRRDLAFFTPLGPALLSDLGEDTEQSSLREHQGERIPCSLRSQGGPGRPGEGRVKLYELEDVSGHRHPQVGDSGSLCLLK